MTFLLYLCAVIFVVCFALVAVLITIVLYQEHRNGRFPKEVEGEEAWRD